MTWDFRIIRTKTDKKKLKKAMRQFADDYCYQIHEVYYEHGFINSWTGPIEPLGCDEKELIGDIILMLQAYNKPVLEIVKDKLEVV